MNKRDLLGYLYEDFESIPSAVLEELKIEVNEELDKSVIKMGVFHNLLLKEYIEKKEK